MMSMISQFAALIDTSSLPSPKSNTTSDVLNIVFALAASVSMLMIVINGFRYIVSRGDASGTASAKNGILYSIVGLLVVMAAYSIVALVVKGVG